MEAMAGHHYGPYSSVFQEWKLALEAEEMEWQVASMVQRLVSIFFAPYSLCTNQTPVYYHQGQVSELFG